jgi:hypothetical protein
VLRIPRRGSVPFIPKAPVVAVLGAQVAGARALFVDNHGRHRLTLHPLSFCAIRGGLQFHELRPTETCKGGLTGPAPTGRSHSV